MEISEDVYKVKGEGNVYVILKPEVVVIDTGDVVDSVAIKSGIEEVVPLGDVKKVLLTHLHYDHAGNVDLFPNAEVYASDVAIENYRGSPKDFFFRGISAKGDEMLRNAKALPIAHAGVPSEEGKINGLKVIECPGHTRGSVAFLDEKRKLLFSGDTIFQNGVGRTDFPNSLPENMEGSVERLKRLLDEGYKLCPGHDY